MTNSYDQKNVPRHVQLAELFGQNIRNGAWPPGHRLPKETDLAAAHGVSRMTMNKVLAHLTREGFLLRRKRGGTFVAQPRTQSAVMEINDIAREVANLGREHRWTRLAQDIRPLTEGETALLDLNEETGAEVLLIRGLHMAKDRPFCLELRAIDLAAAEDARTVDFGTVIPGQWLVDTKPWSRASHRIRAVNLAPTEARELGVKAGTAGLEILRKTQIDGVWVTHVRLLYPSDMHQIVADFAPGPAELA